MNDRSTLTGAAARAPAADFTAADFDVQRSETYGPVEKVVGALVATFVLAPLLGLLSGVWGAMTVRAFEFGWGVG